jgi:hypothetical protein
MQEATLASHHIAWQNAKAEGIAYNPWGTVKLEAVDLVLMTCGGGITKKIEHILL